MLLGIQLIHGSQADLLTHQLARRLYRYINDFVFVAATTSATWHDIVT